jgi:hypothetical protein
MIRTKMYKQIQEFKRKGHSKGEIGAELGLDPKTVAKYFSMDDAEYKAYRQHHMFRDKVLESFELDILDIYEKNEYKRLNMASVHDYLEEKHGPLPANEQSLRNYIHYLILTDKLKLDEGLRTYTQVPELPFGKQMQLDFGEFKCRSGLKLFIFAAVLSASRYKYTAFQSRPFKTRDVIEHLLDCFDYFGGVPEELVIDQDRLMVVSENAGDIVYTHDFGYFIEEQGLSMYVCRKDDPESKGKIENVIKFIKRNFLSIRDFITVEGANAGAVKWLKRRANGKISQATRRIPDILIKHEREHLRPVRNSIFRKDSLAGREERNVNDKDCISVNACGYRLPSKYRNKTVEVYVTRHKLFIFDIFTGEEIAEYDLSPIPGKIISKREYGREAESTLEELKGQVIHLFPQAIWKAFAEKNFRTYSRYVRDQCVEAKKYFGDNNIDSSILGRALDYCLENNTLTFADLHDTYHYFKREGEETEILPPDMDYQGGHEPLNVSARDLSVYKRIANPQERANESV